MNRRKYLSVLGIGSASALAIGTDAFTSVSANRTVSVEAADDNEALLALDQRGTGERSEFDGTPATLEFNLPGDEEGEYPDGNPTDPQGLGTDSVYRFGMDAGAQTQGLFRVQNQGTQPVQIYSTQSETGGVPEVTTYNVETGNTLTEGSPSPPLPTGNRFLCGLEVNTHGVPVQETEYDVTLTINAVVDSD